AHMSKSNLVTKQALRRRIWSMSPIGMIGMSSLRRRIVFVSILVTLWASLSTCSALLAATPAVQKTDRAEDPSVTIPTTAGANDLQEVKFVGGHALSLQNILKTQESEMFALLDKSDAGLLTQFESLLTN